MVVSLEEDRSTQETVVEGRSLRTFKTIEHQKSSAVVIAEAIDVSQEIVELSEHITQDESKLRGIITPNITRFTLHERLVKDRTDYKSLRGQRQ